MATREQVLASADRAAARKLEDVRRRAEKSFFQANNDGRLGSGSHMLSEQRIWIEGFRDTCEAAAIRVAEIEQAKAKDFAEPLRALLLAHQLAAHHGFEEYALPGNSPMLRKLLGDLLPQFHTQLDRVLDEVLDDLSIGIAGGVNVKSHKGVHVDLGGGAAQVMVDSPGGSQHVGRDQVGQGIDRHALLQLLSMLRQDVAAAGVPAGDKELVEDAILNAEREVASASPDPSRIKRLTQRAADVAVKIGISAAGGTLGQIIQSLAGMG